MASTTTSFPVDESLELLKEFIDCHGCPTVIVDCSPSIVISTTVPRIVHCNPSYALWIRRSSCPESRFKDWAESLENWDSIELGNTANTTYAGMNWVVHFVGGRWGILQSQSPFNDLLCLDKDSLNRPRKRLRSADESRSPLMLSPTLTPVQEAQICLTDPLDPPGLVADWTRFDIPNPSEWVVFMRNHDWTKTVIGPMQGWSLLVRQNVFFMMGNPKPSCIYIGYEDPVMLYNEACSKLLGKLHPEAMGVTGEVGAGAAWPRKYAGIKRVLTTGQPFREEDLYHPVPRGSLELEEAYFSWWTLPLIDHNGRIFGVIKEFEETSTRVIHERRERTLQKAEHMLPSENIDAFWTQVHDVIASNPEDFPFCLLYSAPPRQTCGQLNRTSFPEPLPNHFKLQGSIGLERSSTFVQENLDPSEPKYCLTREFQAAWVSGRYVLLRSVDNTLPSDLRIDVTRVDHYSRCHTAVLYPINQVDGVGVVGFLLLGLNPERNFDEAFRSFLRSLTDQFIKAAAAILVPEEREILLRQKIEAEDRERIFTRLARLAPIGWSLQEPGGKIRHKNTNFDMLVNAQKDDQEPFGFKIPIHRKDWPHVLQQFKQSVVTRTDVDYQFRVQADLKDNADEDRVEDWRWLSANARSDADDDGNCLWVTTFFTDITAEKANQRQTLEDAMEMKRQSENFIDMTCHEMRNPLSAIIQSADGVLTAFETPSSGAEGITLSEIETIPADIRTSVQDSAHTILLCAQHQKRIVDDILTISKLESCKLQICPDKVEPFKLVDMALAMYDAELVSAGIIAGMDFDPSYNALDVQNVFLDRARLLQVLINLLTNAIKFTRTQSTKKISIVLSAYTSAPTGTNGMSFIPQRESREDILTLPEWGKGEELYLQFDVRDTGRGMTTDERNRLFKRFSQASLQTYSQYGGSGLGLFISRELTELHGGQIGVSSTFGEGTTFAFYIKTRRYEAERSEQAATAGNPPTLDASMLRIPSETSCDPKELHILLVEDNLINQRVTAQQLRKAGCTVHVANHGQECLNFLLKTSLYVGNSDALDNGDDLGDLSLTETSNLVRKDSEATVTSPESLPLSVILLDQEMPVMDGLTCVRRIREMQESGALTSHIPVIACTGNARVEQIATSLEAGMDEVVTKPFRIPELLPRMFALIARLNAAAAHLSTGTLYAEASQAE